MDQQINKKEQTKKECPKPPHDNSLCTSFLGHFSVVSICSQDDKLILTDEEIQSWNNYVKEYKILCPSCEHQKREFIRYRRYMLSHK